MAEKEKEWKVTVVKGRGVISKVIKVKQQRIEKPIPQVKDKLGLVLEEIQDVSKNLKRCEQKIDKLKKEK